MNGKTIVAEIPASSANLGPGFDSLGLALNLYNRVTLHQSYGSGVVVRVIGEGAAILPRDEHNLVAVAVKRLLDRVGYRPGALELELENRIPLERGLGSSAAAIVGGLLTANELAGKKLSGEQLLEMAVEIEGHPDNVAAALFGGVVIAVKEKDRYYYKSIRPHHGLAVTVVIPDFPLSTGVARSVLPSQVAREDAVFNLGRVALLIAALHEGDWRLLRLATEDRLHQPYRSPLVPGLEQILASALEAGAYGAALSGAGPTVVAFSPPGSPVGEAMAGIFRQQGVQARVLELAPCGGACIVAE